MNSYDRYLMKKFLDEPLNYDLEYYVATILELLEFSSKPISEIDNNDILKWINYLKSIKVNKALINETESMVNIFFSSLFDKGLLTKDPTVHNSKSNLQQIS